MPSSSGVSVIRMIPVIVIVVVGYRHNGIPTVDIEAVAAAAMVVITLVLAAMVMRRERVDQWTRHEHAGVHDHVEQPERGIPGSPDVGVPPHADGERTGMPRQLPRGAARPGGTTGGLAWNS